MLFNIYYIQFTPTFQILCTYFLDGFNDDTGSGGATRNIKVQDKYIGVTFQFRHFERSLT
jgi:hypothetical protein